MMKYTDDYIFEKYLDNEQKYYDYGTAPVSENDIIDTKHTGVSFYDQFLGTSELEYLRDKKNLKGEIVMMSPKEYYEICASKIFNTSVERLKKERGEFDRNIIDKLHRVVKVYKRKLCLPFINYADQGQEGLHRMLTVAEILGWDHKVPVLIVDWYDKDRATKEINEKKKHEIDNRVKFAIEKALEYNYRSVEELKDQLQWELDRSFEFYGEVESPVKFEFTEEKNSFLLTTLGYEYPVDKEDVKFVKDSSSDESSDDNYLDDVDIDDLDNWLVKYLGNDWEQEFPDAKKKIQQIESIQPDWHHRNESNNTITERTQDTDVFTRINNLIYSTFGQSYLGDGCIYIAPDGTFLNIYPRLDDHEDLSYWLEDNGIDEEYIIEDAEWFVDKFQYVRCRNSLHLCFCHCPETITSAQLRSLETWMEEKVRTSLIEVTINNDSEIYDTDKYFPEDIIKLIRRYYASGTLYR